MLIEKIEYEVNWKAFKRGTSFFIPCLDIKAAEEEIYATTKRLKLKILTKQVVFEGVKGLRVWRV